MRRRSTSSSPRRWAARLFDLRPGEGAIVEIDGEKVAAFVDDDTDPVHALGALPAPGLHGGLERPRPDLGLPLPRVAL